MPTATTPADRILAAILAHGDDLRTDNGYAYELGLPLSHVYEALDRLRGEGLVKSTWAFGAWFHFATAEARGLIHIGDD